MLPAERVYYHIRYYAHLFIILLAGCGISSVYLTVTRPAEINLKAYDKIAIGDIVSQKGWSRGHASDLSDEITAALFSSDAFEVLDRQHLGALLKEHSLGETGLIDESTAVQVGQFIGTAALVFGRIQSDSYREEVIEGKVTTDDKGKKHQWNTRRGTYDMAVILKVIDVETAKIIAVKTITATRSRTTRADMKEPRGINSNRLFSDCVKDISRQFIRMVAPYQERVRAAFLTDKQVPETEQAVAMFRIGEWEDGIAILERTTLKSPLPSEVQAKTFYNLGLAQIYMGRYDEAVENLKRALILNPTSRRIQHTILRAKEEKESAARLQEQVREESD